MGDVHQQVLLDEALNSGLGCHSRNNLECRWSDIDIGDEDSSMEVVRCQMLGEVSHLLDTDRGIREELDPNGADISTGGVWVARSGNIGVSLHHGIAWSCRESHQLAPVIVSY